MRESRDGALADPVAVEDLNICVQPAVTLAPEMLVTRWVDVVTRWVEAFNARDLEDMIACLDPDVRFHPLHPGGLDWSYEGHSGVRRWFERLTQLRLQHFIGPSDIRLMSDGQVLVAGAIRLDENVELGSFCALHLIADGLIVAAHHYLTDEDLLERVGLIA